MNKNGCPIHAGICSITGRLPGSVIPPTVRLLPCLRESRKLDLRCCSQSAIAAAGSNSDGAAAG
jgi:hypothetical protein